MAVDGMHQQGKPAVRVCVFCLLQQMLQNGFGAEKCVSSYSPLCCIFHGGTKGLVWQQRLADHPHEQQHCVFCGCCVSVESPAMPINFKIKQTKTLVEGALVLHNTLQPPAG